MFANSQNHIISKTWNLKRVHTDPGARIPHCRPSATHQGIFVILLLFQTIFMRLKKKFEYELN